MAPQDDTFCAYLNKSLGFYFFARPFDPVFKQSWHLKWVGSFSQHHNSLAHTRCKSTGCAIRYGSHHYTNSTVHTSYCMRSEITVRQILASSLRAAGLGESVDD